MDTIFDELSAAVAMPAFDWRSAVAPVLGNLLTGMTIGLGIAAGLALAG